MSETLDTWGELRRYTSARLLLGCEWGRTIALPGDSDPCEQQAVQITVLHDPASHATVSARLCAVHREQVLAQTDPHAEGAL